MLRDRHFRPHDHDVKGAVIHERNSRSVEETSPSRNCRAAAAGETLSTRYVPSALGELIGPE